MLLGHLWLIDALSVLINSLILRCTDTDTDTHTDSDITIKSLKKKWHVNSLESSCEVLYPCIEYNMTRGMLLS